MSRVSTRNTLAMALLAALATPGLSFAQDAISQNTAPAKPASDQNSDGKKDLGKIVVTGSLIPQTEKETFKPVLTITAEDMQNRGYTSVADALQRTAFATGGVQGSQSSASFTQGAETTSMFGLNPGYTKYLINGRPMANYPALYNGSDVFNNISGIPSDLVDRIEVLPGGQSSLYGSDAIAGVINIILKKKMTGVVLSGRIGDYSDGGGRSQRGSIATGFSSKNGKFNLLFGAQGEKSDPIWAYDRDLTKQFNTHGYNGAKPLASRDWLVYSPFTSYNFMDPANCANLKGAFGGSEALQTRPGFGDTHYCGSYNTPGYRTLKNGKRSTQAYTRATYDINDHTQLYAEYLYSREMVDYSVGSNFTWWGTSVKWGYYYDPNVPGDLLNLQRAFAPEEMGGFQHAMNKDKSIAYTGTLGINGTFGHSNWDYDLGLTHNTYRLTSLGFNRFAGPIEKWFEQHVLGPQQGLDPMYGAYPVFTPNYAAFYTLMTPADFQSFTGYTRTNSRTYDNMLRGQVTNGSLFHLPGGDAGVAVAAEWGTQGWTYTPDPRLMDGEVWGTTDVSGQGSRSRYAVTAELRAPVAKMLTLTGSGRYDSYNVSGKSVAKSTYAMGVEFRPFESLLFRGKYGTAFKVPTLSDEFQGTSGFYNSTIDYLNCNRAGFGPGNVDNCPQRFSSLQYFGQTSGNSQLQPITAKVWSYGVVWAPTNKFSIGVDYHHWNIRNEVATQNVNQLMLDELNCTSVANGGTGTLSPTSGTCQAAFAQIHRGAAGNVQSIYAGKVNVAREVLNALTLELNYRQSLGRAGDLKFNLSATHNVSHLQQTYPTDPMVDLIRNPYYSSDPRDKGNASVSWSKNRITATLYADYIGTTPNYRAGLDAKKLYSFAGAGKLGSYTTYNASINFKVTKDFQVSLLANNLFNRYPDMDLSYPGNTGEPYNSGNYNAYGRSIFLEARWGIGGKND
ncbi:TonB-dependent receptor plug domain-containing protein [Solilutibacter silvestris]|uniref:TonB-dependent Receptor Plug Domain-containing protein n=1 Tax=Solilutibacter silvestris TaxID=1645665 RepID=A0A2K1PYW8_9GAMM|nr:TonB-dependent receptor [Lysobacter silvestris]PNS07994.1 TonB-dependent Receptor Plug Domain-containing protein [Lysobacter silvestris]